MFCLISKTEFPTFSPSSASFYPAADAQFSPPTLSSNPRLPSIFKTPPSIQTAKPPTDIPKT